MNSSLLWGGNVSVLVPDVPGQFYWGVQSLVCHLAFKIAALKAVYTKVYRQI